MLIDCFTYFNEKELLELRIETLKDTVDLFLIADADRTHKGEPKAFSALETIKELGLPEEKIQVIHIELPSPEEAPDPWIRERAQRDALAVAMRMIEGDHIFFVSDCDEIARPSTLLEAAKVSDENPTEFVRLSMPFLMNRADLQCHNAEDKPMEWIAGTLVRSQHVRDESTLSQIRADLRVLQDDSGDRSSGEVAEVAARLRQIEQETLGGGSGGPTADEMILDLGVRLEVLEEELQHVVP